MKKKFNRILSVGLSVVMGMAITGCTTVEAPPNFMTNQMDLVQFEF